MDNNKYENENNDESLIENNDNIEMEELSDNDDSFTYRADGGYSNNKNYDDQKSFLYIIVGVLILISIIVLLVIFANSKKDKANGYSDIESKMIVAAKDYYKKNQEKLPIGDDSISISIESLVEGNYLKPISEMIDNGGSCSGYVNVYKSSNEYVYFPYLNCGESYESKRLSSKVIDDSFVTSGDGLYKYGNGYVFRGEYPNNFVRFDDSNWRIIKINSDGSLKLLYIDKKVEKNVWDDRYNSSRESYSGINDFTVSRVLEYLKDIYENNTFVSKKNDGLLAKNSWCIGKISQDDVPINSMNVCSETYDDLYIGLLTVDEVLIPSLSDKCINMFDIECTNYNYFFNISTGWTLNASSDKTYIVYNTGGGSVSTKSASDLSNIRPVININGNVLFKSGDGTESKPYIIGD